MKDLMNRYYDLNPGVAVRRIKDELFFITPASAELHTLNLSGLEVWDSLMAGEKPIEIVEKMAEETDGQLEVIESDIAELISLLLEKGILKRKA